jgi:hypothetical protein
MAKHDIQMVLEALGLLSQVLGSPKVAVDERTKSGIYEIQCQTCPVVYYGQKRRNIDEQFKEHMSMVRTRAEEKSSVAKHRLNNPGKVKIPEELSLIKMLDHPHHLDASENIIIYKNYKKHLLNEDYVKIESSLIDFFSKNDFWYCYLKCCHSLINSHFQVNFIVLFPPASPLESMVFT